MSILKPNQLFEDYVVESLIKDGEYNETYRIRRNDGTTLFMKLYDPGRLPREAKNDEGKVIEIELTRGLRHENVIRYEADGIHEAGGKAYPYIITNYFSGRLLSETVSGGFRMDPEEVIGIYREVLIGLAYLHGEGLVHNDVTPRNVMYDPDTRRVQLIDMGHVAHAGTKEHHYLTRDLSAWYRSPESMHGLNDPRGDVFAASAVAFALLTGKAPWEKELPAYDEKDRDYESRVKTAVHLARKSQLDFGPGAVAIEPWLQATLRGALTVKPENRLSPEQILTALERREAPAEEKPRQTDKTPQQKTDRPGCIRQKSAEQESTAADEPAAVKKGRGFEDVAGMDELKDLLQKKVLFILKDKEKAAKYKLTPPNGMLLYGPPGCGKTYFAEKFAEESGFNYKFIKASDLGSIYVHGGQGKIAELFDKARQKAPIIICFDEFDAMVPNRASRSAEHISGEVNEFLSQLNNCSKDGIFVIGTTNQPEMIDPAVLRKGRVDISVYIPAPDVETRRLMFDLYLKDRPVDKVDTQQLAEMTDKYVASDIAFIVNDAAMIAAFRDELITQDVLMNSIKTTRPSLNQALLDGYERTRQKLENTQGAEPRPRVGFVQYQ